MLFREFLDVDALGVLLQLLVSRLKLAFHFVSLDHLLQSRQLPPTLFFLFLNCVMPEVFDVLQGLLFLEQSRDCLWLPLVVEQFVDGEFGFQRNVWVVAAEEAATDTDQFRGELGHLIRPQITAEFDTRQLLN